MLWCPNCGAEIAKTVALCPACGADFSGGGWGPVDVRPPPADNSMAPLASGLGVIGILIPPLALVGLVLSLVAIRQTNVGPTARRALTINSIVVGGWGLLTFAAFFGISH